MELKDLGYNAYFEDGRQALALGECVPARVISENRGSYWVKDTTGEYLATVTGKQMFEALSREDYPAVGDWVLVSIEGTAAIIRGILPRRTLIKRKRGDRTRARAIPDTQVIAANIDEAFIVESVDRDYSLNRFERYISVVESGGVLPVLVLNKVDLLTPQERSERLDELRKRFPSITVFFTSVAQGEGVVELLEYISPGRTYGFLGSSGVGKSSLVNNLLGQAFEKTGEIGFRSGRGRHVTTRRQMYFLKNGGMVIDNPGMREIGLTDGEGVGALFDAIEAQRKLCKFADCTHTHEPGCAVSAAAKEGVIDEGQYENYLHLKKEAEYAELSENGKREKHREFGKFVNKGKKDLKKFGHKDY